MTPAEKYERLKEVLAALGGAVVAFSGGVDSTLLLKAARDALGDRAIAATARSALVPEREHDEAVAFCKAWNIKQIVFDIDVGAVDGIAANTARRCYFCKSYILKCIWQIAGDYGIVNVVEGSNVDDESDFRPGAEAVREQGVLSPLRMAGFTKVDIRAASKELGLDTWDKQSFSCLANRVPYGERITGEVLEKVSRAEQALADIGLKQYRVRCHGDMARIETDETGYAVFYDRGVREKVYGDFKKIGFLYTAIDLMGYRTGSMNEKLS